MNVGVIFGGRSVEHQVSVASARTVAGALSDAGHDVVATREPTDGEWGRKIRVMAQTNDRPPADEELAACAGAGMKPDIRGPPDCANPNVPLEETRVLTVRCGFSGDF